MFTVIQWFKVLSQVPFEKHSRVNSLFLKPLFSMIRYDVNGNRVYIASQSNTMRDPVVGAS